MFVRRNDGNSLHGKGVWLKSTTLPSADGWTEYLTVSGKEGKKTHTTVADRGYGTMAQKINIALACVLGLLLALVAQPAQSGHKALIIGIEEYPISRLKLRGVRDDVKLLQDVLTRRGFFSQEETRILLDKDATKQNIVKNFREWLINGTSPGDTALFFFSGHGIQVWDENGDEIQDGMDEALVCWDTKILKPKVRRTFAGVPGFAYELKDTEHVLLDDEIHDLLKELQGRTVIFLSDSCHAGSVYKRLDPFFVLNKTIDQPFAYKSVFDPRTSEVSGQPVRRKATGIVDDAEIPGVRLAAYTASEDSQPAQVVVFDRDPKGFHSVFSWHLYHGLMGKADLGRTGGITFASLAKYLHDEIRSSGFAQVPQSVFSPKSIAEEPFGKSQVRPLVVAGEKSELRVEKPATIGCMLEGGKRSNREIEEFKSGLSSILPTIRWTDDQGKASCRITLEKNGRLYGARLSDATGTYWETHKGPSLPEVMKSLAGNITALYIQTNLAALHDRPTSLSFDLTYTVKGPRKRAAGEAVNGDTLVFRAKASTPGYLYVLSVDSAGVIHPLYPGPHEGSKRLEPGQETVIGSDGSFVVREPFGKEMVYAFLFEKPPTSLSSYWAKNDIGDTQKASVTEQQKFLDALWNELASSGKPQTAWASQMSVITSFKE
jgi:hypothetical protein